MAAREAWKRIGILGGSFDPPHLGHVFLGATALLCAQVDGLFVIPVCVHPLGKPLSPFVHRLAMTQLAFRVLDPERVLILDIEAKLPEPNWTYRTLEALRAHFPKADLVLVLGEDSARELDRWQRPEVIRSLASLFVVGRGLSSMPFALPPISSSEIRARVRQGQGVEGLVGSEVDAYIRRHHLYREP
ncbi:MAG: nicotinate-nicotinamide nucleotide adenylyltransferase [Sandaracinaceae bacterium]|nr:nicotinate-nicotinamide nucleotide adenylyltransferase [Sandaracinaceae bacterium]MDW8244963.1 nicotinate-nicotinamide nucleotide adenylyltransferase [Sandaracinaceae bacterium]